MLLEIIDFGCNSYNHVSWLLMIFDNINKGVLLDSDMMTGKTTDKR